MNLANILTLSRIFLTFLLMALLAEPGLTAKALAFAVFLAACVTDYFDGKVARQRNQITDFGKIMDPIADKILVLGIFLSFVQMQLVFAWMVVVIIIREFLITGMRVLGIRRGVILGAERAGKHKTVSQMTTILFILIFLLIKETGLRFGFWHNGWETSFRFGIMFLMSVAVALTIYSGFSYAWKNRNLIKTL